jgi:hypothetical protein
VDKEGDGMWRLLLFFHHMDMWLKRFSPHKVIRKGRATGRWGLLPRDLEKHKCSLHSNKSNWREALHSWCKNMVRIFLLLLRISQWDSSILDWVHYPQKTPKAHSSKYLP